MSKAVSCTQMSVSPLRVIRSLLRVMSAWYLAGNMAAQNEDRIGRGPCRRNSLDLGMGVDLVPAKHVLKSKGSPSFAVSSFPLAGMYTSCLGFKKLLDKDGETTC